MINANLPPHQLVERDAKKTIGVGVKVNKSTYVRPPQNSPEK